MIDPVKKKAAHKLVVESDWFKGRPKNIQEFILDCPLYYEYEVKSTGQPCRIYSYCEDDDGGLSLTILIVKDGRPLHPKLQKMQREGDFYSHRVFGIKPNGLKIIGLMEKEDIQEEK